MFDHLASSFHGIELTYMYIRISMSIHAMEIQFIFEKKNNGMNDNICRLY